MIRHGRQVRATLLREVQVPEAGALVVALHVCFGAQGQVSALASPAPRRDDAEAMLVGQLVRDLNARLTAHGGLSVRALRRQAEALLNLLDVLEEIEDALGPDAAAMLREPAP